VVQGGGCAVDGAGVGRARALTTRLDVKVSLRLGLDARRSIVYANWRRAGDLHDDVFVARLDASHS
jgi:hypothetical protein